MKMHEDLLQNNVSQRATQTKSLKKYLTPFNMIFEY